MKDRLKFRRERKIHIYPVTLRGVDTIPGDGFAFLEGQLSSTRQPAKAIEPTILVVELATCCDRCEGTGLVLDENGLVVDQYGDNRAPCPTCLPGAKVGKRCL